MEDFLFPGIPVLVFLGFYLAMYVIFVAAKELLKGGK